jgi:predicted glycoside hydrolase/deacetylase ChbG (UPF0249 family)
VSGTRRLIVVADDFGIGPATSQGILDVAQEGRLTGAVLLVNSPYAEEAVREWRRRGAPVPLGWHPCLTLDRPVLPGEKVPSLVEANGGFPRLGACLTRLTLGRARLAELVAELAAQYRRFVDLVGRPPAFVNGHQHVHIFPGAGTAVREVLGRQSPRPFLRRVGEPLSLWLRVPGARVKRAFLATLGRLAAKRQERNGFPGADCLAGVTDPRWVEEPGYFARWLAHAPGAVVELMVHPGHHDETLIGRDCEADDGLQRRRENELRLLRQPEFQAACRAAGFTLTPPVEWTRCGLRGGAHVA